MKPESLSEKLMFNTVRLETELGMGTGFFYNFKVGENIYPTIITNRHVCMWGNAIKLGVRGFVRICIETCARGCFGAWKYRFRKKGMLIRQMLFICKK